MFKGTLSVLVGFVIWFVAATLGNLLLRALIPTYIAVEPVMAFTVPMLLARLAVGFFHRSSQVLLAHMSQGHRSNRFTFSR